MRGRIAQTGGGARPRTRLRSPDDILFVSASAGSPNTGFFQNIGTTRRRGIELGANATAGHLSLSASYTYIDPQFRSSFTEHSPNNAGADANGDIQVNPGNRIPAIPRTSSSFAPRT